MGILARLFGRSVERERGMLADDQPAEEGETPQLRQPPPTPTIRPIERPEPTPSIQPFDKPSSTPGTQGHRQPGGTPSTQRIHNSPRPGRD